MNSIGEKVIETQQVTAIVPLHQIQSMIFSIRGVQVMIDRDLADVYGVENKRLNEQVKRNIERFPEAFRFQLSDSEKAELVANCDRFDSLKHASTNPYAFTEQGVSMLSAVLRSETAIKVSIQIIKAFVETRRFIQGSANLFARLDSVICNRLPLAHTLGAVIRSTLCLRSMAAESGQKETLVPLNCKQLRKGYQGQRGELHPFWCCCQMVFAGTLSLSCS